MRFNMRVVVWDGRHPTCFANTMCSGVGRDYQQLIRGHLFARRNILQRLVHRPQTGLT
jgi:hypothetical protein